MRRKTARARRRILKGIAIAVSIAFGCTTPIHDRAAAARAGRSAQVLLVLPLNVTLAMPEGLGDQSVDVWKELEAFLLSQGKRLKTVSYPVARQLWLKSVARAQNPSERRGANYPAAVSLFTRELRRHAEFDALIAPSLFVQQATVTGAQASWDGVTRLIEIHRDNRRIRRRTVHSSSTAHSASIHVSVLDDEGRTIHEGQGGLDLLVRARVDEDLGQSMSTNVFWYFESRPIFFDDPAKLREGIAVAFQPFLPPEGLVRSPL